MNALAAAFAALALASAVPPMPARDVRWILGPAQVELLPGRVRCALPGEVAIAAGAQARAILQLVAGTSDGTELAVVSPTDAGRRWYVVLGWEPGVAGAPRRWSVTSAGKGDAAVVNEHVRLPGAGGALRVTLVAPAPELAGARAQLERILDGLRLSDPRTRARR